MFSWALFINGTSLALGAGLGADLPAPPNPPNPKSRPPAPATTPAPTAVAPTSRTPAVSARPAAVAPKHPDTPVESPNMPAKAAATDTPAVGAQLNPGTAALDDAAETTRKPLLITRDDIDRHYGYDIAQLLQTCLGVDIRREGGAGAESDVFFGGANERQIVVYLDDIRITDPVRGDIMWQLIPLSQVGWIEIRRGLEATQQGANAIAASVHIYTRRPYTSGGSFGGVIANYGTYGIEAGYYDNEKNIFFDLAMIQHDGISATNARNSAYNEDIDGTNEFTVRAGYQSKLSPTVMFDISTMAAHSNNAYDPGTLATDWQLGRAALQSSIGRWQQRLQFAGWHKISYRRILTETKLRTAHTEMVWDNKLSIGKRSLIRFDAHFFADMARQTDVATSLVKLDNRLVSDSGLNITLDSPIFRNNFTFQARYDYHNVFGNISTYGLQWGRFVLLPDLYTNVAIHSGYTPPTIKDRYYVGDSGGQYVGNKSVGFEKSTQLDITTRYQFERDHSVSLMLYGTRIDYVMTYTGLSYTPKNNEQYNLLGAQASYQYRESDWLMHLTADFQKNTTRNTALPYRPAQKFLAQLTRRIANGYTLEATGQFVDARTDNLKRILDPYALFGVALTKTFMREYSFALIISNLFDKAYETDYGNNMPGRVTMLRMRYTPRGG
ncbi:MAG: TonB-dependent receptor plug domain-containing protein [Pseudomonadota bacterium]